MGFIMVWGYLRLTLFTMAFLIGLVVTGWLGMGPVSASSGSDLPRLGQAAGTSLVVVCDEGKVIVTPVADNKGAVHLQCLQSKMRVVRDHQAPAEKIPDLHALPTWPKLSTAPKPLLTLGFVPGR